MSNPFIINTKAYEFFRRAAEQDAERIRQMHMRMQIDDYIAHKRRNPNGAHAPSSMTWCATCEREITAGQPRYCRRCNTGFDAQGRPT